MDTPTAEKSLFGNCPTITLDPDHGPPGTELILTGKGFEPASRVRIYATGRAVQEVLTGAFGHFRVTLGIPQRAHETVLIGARDKKGRSAFATFGLSSRRSSPRPGARISPRSASISKGRSAFFSARRSKALARDTRLVNWQWEGPDDQAATGTTFLVDTAQLKTGRHLVKLTVTDNRGNSHSRSAEFQVAPSVPNPHPRQPATLIKEIHLEKAKVRSGEYFTVSVDTDSPTGERVDVRIHGSWANPRVLQIKGGTGVRQLQVVAVTSSAYDERYIDVEVIHGRPERQFEDFYVGEVPQRRMRAAFRIFDQQLEKSSPAMGAPAKDTRRYFWDFGDGKHKVTTVARTTHDYSQSLDPSTPNSVFQATVYCPETDTTGRKTVTVWNPTQTNLPYGIRGEVRNRVPIPQPPLGGSSAPEEKHALVLSGGGSKGAFQVGVVKYLYDQGFRPLIITGTSVGALNAAKLAEGFLEDDEEHAASRLEDLWRDIRENEDIYENSEGLNRLIEDAEDLEPDFWDVLVWFVGGGPVGGIGLDWTIIETVLLEVPFVLQALRNLEYLFDQTGLENRVNENLDPERIAASGIVLLIGAVDIHSSRIRFFRQDGALLNRSYDEIEPPGSVDLRQAVLASSAIPAAFRRIRILGKDYVDGAVREDIPLRAALEYHPSNVMVVSTSPKVFEPSHLIPIDWDSSPRALEVFFNTVEILADEVALNDLQGHVAINKILREIYPDAAPYLFSYPVGHRTHQNPFMIDRIVPTIDTIYPPWVTSETTDFDRATIRASIALGKKVAELSTTEIPGGLTMKQEICRFVEEKMRDSENEDSPIHYQYDVWAEWYYAHCYVAPNYAGEGCPDEECVSAERERTEEQYREYRESGEEERDYWRSYCIDNFGEDWCDSDDEPGDDG
jgi:predicted acylesterase/phospholipase RssA